MARNTLRIGQFADSYPPVINGVSAFVHEHHGELLARGVDAHIFTFGYTWHRRASELRNVWRTFGLPLGASPFRANIDISWRAQQTARALNVLHVHEPFGIGWIAGRVQARRHRIPMVFTVHTRHDLYIPNWPRLMQRWMNWQAGRTIATLIRHSQIATAPSSDTVRWLQGLAPDQASKLRVIRNGIRLDHFDSMPPIAREALGVANGDPVFIYVGRLTPEKNLGVALDAFIGAVQQGAQAHLWIVGDGERRAELETRAQSVNGRVRFFGALPRQVVPSYLRAANVFVTASLSEANPVSVIEALAAGLPYIGIDSAWWTEFDPAPPAAQAGLLAKTPAELAGLICRMAADPHLRATLGAGAKSLSRRFDIRDVTSQWLEIYQSVII